MVALVVLKTTMSRGTRGHGGSGRPCPPGRSRPRDDAGAVLATRSRAGRPRSPRPPPARPPPHQPSRAGRRPASTSRRRAGRAAGSSSSAGSGSEHAVRIASASDEAHGRSRSGPTRRLWVNSSTGSTRDSVPGHDRAARGVSGATVLKSRFPTGAAPTMPVAAGLTGRVPPQRSPERGLAEAAPCRRR